jgi:hypothetical protein
MFIDNVLPSPVVFRAILSYKHFAPNAGHNPTSFLRARFSELTARFAGIMRRIAFLGHTAWSNTQWLGCDDVRRPG